jgi:multiple sugar transport system permease protein
VNATIEKYTPKLMVLPTFVILLIISLVPLIYVLGISFTDSTISKPFNDFIWFENYKKALTDEVFGDSLVNTLIFAFVVTTIQTFLGFVLAFAMQRERKLSGVLRTLALLPLFTPPVAIAMIWRLIYDPNQGMLNYYMIKWGLVNAPVAFLGDKTLAFPSIMLADIWQWTPFCFLLCLAALQSLPRDPYEAAMVDGASAWYVFKRLTLPMVAPQVIVIFLFRFLIALKVFDLIYMLTFGGPGNTTQVASFYIYRVSFKQFQTGYGGALSILVLILISVLATLLTKGRELLLKRVE